MWSWSLLLHIYITILTVPLHNTPFFTGIYKPLLQVHSSRTTHRLFAERVFSRGRSKSRAEVTRYAESNVPPRSLTRRHLGKKTILFFICSSHDQRSSSHRVIDAGAVQRAWLYLETGVSQLPSD